MEILQMDKRFMELEPFTDKQTPNEKTSLSRLVFLCFDKLVQIKLRKRSNLRAVEIRRCF